MSCHIDIGIGWNWRTQYHRSSLTLISTEELFYRLIFKPKMHPKTVKINLRFHNSSLLAFEKKIVSSTNWRSDTLVLSFPTKKPLSSALKTILLKTSATIVKKKWERGSSCLKSLDALTQPLTPHSLEWQNL